MLEQKNTRIATGRRPGLGFNVSAARCYLGDRELKSSTASPLSTALRILCIRCLPKHETRYKPLLLASDLMPLLDVYSRRGQGAVGPKYGAIV
jgi:hypothetical protein